MEQDTAFNTLKQALMSKPALQPPDGDKPFKLFTDASLHTVSAILVQDHAIPCQCARDRLDYCIQVLLQFFLQCTFAHSTWMQVLEQTANVISRVQEEP